MSSASSPRPPLLWSYGSLSVKYRPFAGGGGEMSMKHGTDYYILIMISISRNTNDCCVESADDSDSEDRYPLVQAGHCKNTTTQQHA